MEEGVYAKFSQNPELMAKLRELPKPIVEFNNWHDNFWGECLCESCQNKGKGLNYLGQILERVSKAFVL